VLVFGLIELLDFVGDLVIQPGEKEIVGGENEV